MVQNFQFANGDNGFQYISALDVTDGDLNLLSEWEDSYEFSRIPVLGVEEQFDTWDSDGYCPTFWVLGRDLSVMEVDVRALEFTDVQSWL